MGNIILALFYFLFPVLVIYLDKKISIVKKFGPVLICYGMGLLIGNTGLIPDGVTEFQESLYSGVVILAIPLLLFSLDILKWVKMAGKTFLSLVLGLISVVIMVIIGAMIYFSMMSIFTSEQVDITSPRGIVNGVYVYFGWIGQTASSLWDIGADTAHLVGNAIKVDNNEDDNKEKR